MKHNISITMDQQLFRQIENTRGREKRSTYIEHLIIEGLKNQQKQALQAKSVKLAPTVLPTVWLNHQKTKIQPQ